MLSVLVGLIVVGFSLWGMIRWRWELGFVLKGLLPLSFFLGGIVAIIAGFSAGRNKSGS
jgi:hypothetical protein